MYGVIIKKYILAKQHRIRENKDYNDVFLFGNRITNKYFITIAKQNNYNLPRLGLLIGKKKIKKAVKRNKIKRIIKESFRLNQYNLPKVDMVIIAKSTLQELTDEEFWKKLDKQWKILAIS